MGSHHTFHKALESPRGIFSFSLGLGLHWKNIIIITKLRVWSIASSQQRSHLDRKAGKFLSPVVNTRDVMTTHLVISGMSFVHPFPGWAHDASVPTEGKLARSQKRGLFLRQPQERYSAEQQDWVLRPCSQDPGCLATPGIHMAKKERPRATPLILVTGDEHQ